MIDLYPAIDLLGGRVVRLRQGDYDDTTVYGDDPVAVARRFAADGTRWIHIVDLDAARSGLAVNRPVIAAVVAATPDVSVQTGGGVRAITDVEELAALGVARVVMGSAAVSDPSLVTRAASTLPIAVGLDHRAGEVAVHGWTEGSGVALEEALSWFPDAAVFVITDIARDGMLVGPDVVGLTWAAGHTSTPVIASGGVAALDDLRTLTEVRGLAGVITGKALYDGRFSVRQALDVLEAAP